MNFQKEKKDTEALQKQIHGLSLSHLHSGKLREG